ncbi:hypothetical protein HY989_05860 [Candidatus Micrarchaeota archaeon]|nr:hypothetical protein [Candidatus Micrarchaeota archaeon]
MAIGDIFSNRKVQILLVAVVLAVLLLAIKGPNFGIEFKGGVRIPISLISEGAIAPDTMSLTVDTLKQRINKYGLSQSVVRPLGDKEIIVEIPRADESVLKSIEKILREQGRFEALIDGRAALEGKNVLQGAIGGANGERVTGIGGQYSWELDFAVDSEGGAQFSKVAFGKANFPVYMMLDRPENAAVVISKDRLGAIANIGGIEKAVLDALRKENSDIDLIYSENIEKELEKLAKRTRVITGKLEMNDTRVAKILKEAGFSESAESSKILIVRNDDEMTPQTYSTQLGVTVVSKWRGIGLLSAPTLSAGLAQGTISRSYSINGGSTGATEEAQRKNALAELKELKSVISGGKLPVSTVIGSAYVVAPSLGEQFLTYSFIGIGVAIVAVSLVITIRYRKPTLVVPILIISFLEIFLTTTIIAVFGTLDLAAVAGIIALIGTGVNDQIIITDEILKRGKAEEEMEKYKNVKERIAKAFYIIFAVAGAIIAVMLPLVLSGIVEIMGFGISTIVGVLVGIGITRPAFSAIVQEIS